jgi:type 1 glutamine amidotransferase
MPHALIAVGTGRYADPWHPYEATGAAVATILRDDGWTVDIDDDVDRALTRLGDVDLLVVSAGDPWRNPGDGPDAAITPPAAATEGLHAALERGIGILALHSATASLRDYPAYRAAIGGEWLPGTSWHPPLGPARVAVAASHPVVARLDEIAATDELYSDLIVDTDIEVLVAHELEGTRHPLVWVREAPARAVVSAFGHDARAYDSPDVQRLIRQSADWAGRRARG